MRPEHRKVIESVAANVRAIRLRKGLTQQELAEAAEMDVRHIQMIERGQHSLKLVTFLAVVDALAAKPGTLLRQAIMRPRKGGRPKKAVQLRREKVSAK
jgi:transcriptional regulator with XRE-family HTH domain